MKKTPMFSDLTKWKNSKNCACGEHWTLIIAVNVIYSKTFTVSFRKKSNYDNPNIIWTRTVRECLKGLSKWDHRADSVIESSLRECLKGLSKWDHRADSVIESPLRECLKGLSKWDHGADSVIEISLREIIGSQHFALINLSLNFVRRQ